MRKLGLVMIATLIITVVSLTVGLKSRESEADAKKVRITMRNNTRFTLDFYIDGNHACQASSRRSCAAPPVSPGNHEISAEASVNIPVFGGQVVTVTAGPSYFRPGSSPVWAIEEKTSKK